MCQTFQWRRDAPVRFYLEGGKPEKGHGCVRCDEPWGMGLEFVWHPKCRCRVKGPLPTHELVKETPGKIARIECRCGWTGTGRYKRYDDGEDEEYLDDDFRREIAMDHARSDFEDHKWRAEDRRCDCPCHRQPDCLPVHADRQDRQPWKRPFTCEHSPLA